MKKIVLAVFCILTMRVVACAEELSVVVSGRYHAPIATYKVGPDYFLSAKEAGDIYGAQVYWYPVSGRVQLSLRGRRIGFMVGSSKAVTSGVTLMLPAPVLLRASRAFIPLSFFESDNFAAWSGMDTKFDPHTKLLLVDRRSTVGAVHWFSYGDFTRLTFELASGKKYSAVSRGVSGVDVIVPLGVIDSAEQGRVNDGIVSHYAFKQEPSLTRLSIHFAHPGANWRAVEMSSPRRVAIDVYKEGVPASSAAPPVISTHAAPVSLSSSTTTLTKKRRKIVVDAGHGGKDTGALGLRGTREKDITLAAALELVSLLRQEDAFDVILTRSDDTFIPLSDRSRAANDSGADLFVSVHCNASRYHHDEGFEVYFVSEFASDPEAERTAQAENAVLALEGKSYQQGEEEAVPILLALAKTEDMNASSELAALTAQAVAKRVDLSNRGVKQAGFYVLRGTHAPAILFEMAYLTNAKDEARLGSIKFRRRIVDGIYAGIIDFSRRRGWLK